MSLRKAIALLLTTIFCSVSTIKASTYIDYDVLLNGICAVETAGRYWKIGAAGERSQYQIKRVVWEMYSNVPFWRASQLSQQVEAKRVAMCYISEISKKLNRIGAEINVWNIAVRWNGGISRSHFSSRNRNYATRVNNLYVDSYSPEIDKYAQVVPSIKISIDPIQDELVPALEINLPKKHSSDLVPSITLIAVL